MRRDCEYSHLLSANRIDRLHFISDKTMEPPRYTDEGEVPRYLNEEEVDDIVRNAIPVVRGFFSAPFFGIDPEITNTDPAMLSPDAPSNPQKGRSRSELENLTRAELLRLSTFRGPMAGKTDQDIIDGILEERENPGRVASRRLVESWIKKHRRERETAAVKGLETQLQTRRALKKLSNEFDGLYGENALVRKQLDRAAGLMYELHDLPRRQMRAALKEKVQQDELYETAIPEYRARLYRQHWRTEVDPGEAVGSMATDATSEPATQSTLSSFHVTGTMSAADFGLNAVKSTLRGSAPSSPMSLLHFTDENVTFDEVATKYINLLEEKNADNFVMEADIGTKREFIPGEEPWWYGVYDAITSRPFSRIGPKQFMMRLEIEPSSLYTSRITQYDLVVALHNEFEQDFSVIPSPVLREERILRVALPEAEDTKQVKTVVSVVYIDIIPHQAETEADVLDPNAWMNSMTYSALVRAKKRLPEIHVSGIKGIRMVIPGVQRVVEVIKRAEEVGGEYEEGEDEGEGREWYVYISPIEMYVRGITRERMVNVFEFIGCEDVEWIDDSQLRNISILSCRNGTNPLSLLRKKIDEDEKEATAHEKKQYELKAQLYGSQDVSAAKSVRVSRPPSKLEKLTTIAIADVRGVNTKELWRMPFVNASLTFSNSTPEVVRILGIEAVRNHIIKSLYMALFDSGTRTDMRHLALIGDTMTQPGRLVKFWSEGMLSSEEGSVTKALYSKPLVSISMGAALGEEGTFENPQAAAAVGVIGTVGVGIVDLAIDPAYVEEIEHKREDLSNPDFMDAALDMIDADTFRQSVLVDTTGASITLSAQGGQMTSEISFAAQGSSKPRDVPSWQPAVSSGHTEEAVLRFSKIQRELAPTSDLGSAVAVQGVSRLEPIPEIPRLPPIGLEESDSPYEAYSTEASATSVPSATLNINSILSGLSGVTKGLI